jgi:hypothetical protein
MDVRTATRGPNVRASFSEGSLVLRDVTFSVVCHYLENGNRVLLAGSGQFAAWLYPDTSDIDFAEGRKIACIPFKRRTIHGKKW